jgi:hypothetical protein
MPPTPRSRILLLFGALLLLGIILFWYWRGGAPIVDTDHEIAPVSAAPLASHRA